MVNKSSKPKQNGSRLPVGEILSARGALDASDQQIEARKLHEIVELLWLPEILSEEEMSARILRALDLYEDLKPDGSAESMLAAQMVGTHSAALDCLRRAANENQTTVGRDMALKHAHKLMALYTQQLAALDKHRGKGRQKVTVEHVHVHPGGQAVVGNVETGRRGDKDLHDAEPIDHMKDVSTPTKAAKKRAP
ncbi:hypothetical protein DSM14862_03513 (plasmid) [Sulfitobacter indolifex]|uniref:hypothetical protein n=1 Tax=Sulfitobacter indolifex TaxID=225422 RepID=UPI001FAD2A65|nr:hypothetical protein [Sulfitobacter indolifex]UOA20675.1 hypothetical protein DSM14862_03513 [Sulfitobacter indolifex]